MTAKKHDSRFVADRRPPRRSAGAAAAAAKTFGVVRYTAAKVPKKAEGSPA